MAYEAPTTSGEMGWPYVEPDEKPAFYAHAEPHGSPEHHWRGFGSCDAACRAGRRYHRHRHLKSMGALVAEAAGRTGDSMYVAASRPSREDYKTVTAQVQGRETPEL